MTHKKKKGPKPARWEFISTLKNRGAWGFGLDFFRGGKVVRFPGRAGVKWVRKKGTRRYYARRDR